MKQALNRNGGGARGSRDAWVEAAYRVLINQGVEHVKLGALAASLGLSRTSFYWHFNDREDLLDALIQRWTEKNTDTLIRQTRLYAETITEAMLNLFDCWIDPSLFDARLDFAIRNWAQAAPNLHTSLQSADAERIAAITAMFAKFGFDRETADIRARTVYLTQVGYISMTTVEPLDLRLARMPGYVEAFTGRRPASGEFERFASRHQDRAAA
jgi:AcrR family transcriptional regulator